MLTKIWTGSLLFLAWLAFCAWLVLVCREKNIHPLRDFGRFFKKQSNVGRVLLGTFFIAMWIYASVKPGDGGGNGGGGGGGDGGTNNVPQMVPGPGVGNLQPMNLPGGVAQGLQGQAQFNQTLQPVNQPLGGGTTLNLSGFEPITSTNTTRVLSAEDFERCFVMARVGTDESFDFSAPPDAVVCAGWRAFGAANDWVYAAFTNWAFRVATNDVSCLRVYSFGKIVPQILEVNGAVATNNWFAPFMASLGIVPQANWHLLGNGEPGTGSGLESQVWYAITSEGALLITWQNALLDRDTDKPLSFQVELFTDGRFNFRYDLSRLNVDAVTNILAGASFAGNAWTTNSLPTNVTSMAFYPLTEADAYDQDPDNDGLLTIDELFFYNTDPHNADTDYDGLNDGEELLVYGTDPLNPHSVSADYLDGVAAKLGELNPFDYPEGSTNTVLEHVFYSSTTNGVIVYPQSSVDTAVLEVSVSGTGTGRLVVGDSVVPLVAPPQMRSGAVTNTLLLAVGRGVRKEVWFTKPDGLDVALRSDDLLIGSLPTFYWPHGWLAFPHKEATVPCIHDFNSRGRVVSLVHGEEFPGLTATWSSEAQGVAITNVPPVSAEIHGSFPKSQERSISYTITHPDYICGVTNYEQTLRFCPKHVDEPENGSGGGSDDEEPEYWSCDCAAGGNCSCCSGEWCHCSCWNCPCNANQSPTLGDDDSDAEESFTNIVDGTQQALADVFYLYRANTKAKHLVVPSGTPAECCPCPEHRHTNYVAKVAYTSRVAVDYSDGSGEFKVSHVPCDVTLSGVSPSRDFGDSTVVFVTNGVEHSRHDCTVLGVKFESEEGRPDISEYNRRSQFFGYPVAICTNLYNASSLAFRTDVFLTNGFVRISMENVSGDIALWLPGWWDKHDVWHPPEALLQSSGTRVRNMTLRRWRNIMRRYGGSRSLLAKVISSRPSRCKVKFEFAASNGTDRVYDYAEQRISTVKPPLLADYNWDFSADIKDVLDQGNGRVMYFWTNHDTWRGDDAFSQYSEGSHPWPMTLPDNCDDLVVNGRNDLVNLCPLAVDLSAFIDAWGESGVKYVFYTSVPGDIRFVPTRIKWKQLDGMVKERQKTVEGNDLDSAALLTTASENARETGYVIPHELLALGSSDAGAIAVELVSEGRREPRIAVKDSESGETLFEAAVQVEALDVHRMYRWLNLESACNETVDAKYDDRTTVAWPDSEHADVNVVFVHGYNMHPSEAWDWSQAMFKRLRWSGMDAGFTAVLWRGNESQIWLPKMPFLTEDNGYASRNYHQNVLNAFRTASAFATGVNGLYGSKKYVIAHSLGNMLVSAARQFHGLRYDQYFMLNAAVPVEAYDSVSGVTTNSYHDMTPKEWRQYPDRVRSTHWYEMPWHTLPFGTIEDSRKGLTWKGLFKDVDNTVNFYSSKDEVVANGGDKVDSVLSREYAWYNQEMAKGSLLVSFNPQAGWGFNDHYLIEEFEGFENGEPQYRYRKYTPEEANLIADTNLMARPFFKDFRDEELYGEGGNVFLQSNSIVRWYALSHGIPAESFATGANPVPKWDAAGNNVDMAVECNPSKESEKPVEWVHSYFIRKSLFETKILYENLVDRIGSTKLDNYVNGEDDE